MSRLCKNGLNGGQNTCHSAPGGPGTDADKAVEGDSNKAINLD